MGRDGGLCDGGRGWWHDGGVPGWDGGSYEDIKNDRKLKNISTLQESARKGGIFVGYIVERS